MVNTSTKMLTKAVWIFFAVVSVNCNEIKNILVLGGNGFIGSHLISSLVEEPYNITILNRGNEYFNSKHSIEPFVKRVITCDRKTLLRETCKELLEPIIYDVVIDFSSYIDQQIEQVIDILQNKVKMYIFISSDSVYEVRAKKHEGPTEEEDSDTRIEDEKIEEKMIQDNQYGANKLSCEQRLLEQRKRFGFPYVILRLADVIGERDTTMRWWGYQLLIKLHKELNITVPLPKGIQDDKFSVVYVGDVVDVIKNIIKDPKPFNDQTINLALKEGITLKELLTKLGACLNIEDINFEYDETTAWFRYPSVQKGPIDISKAELLFNWQPIGFEDALKKTCDFFENAMVDESYAEDREILFGEFIEEVLPENFDNTDHFEATLLKLYGPLVFKGMNFDVVSDEKQIEQKSEL